VEKKLQDKQKCEVSDVGIQQ